jgi:hypothetical protein
MRRFRQFHDSKSNTVRHTTLANRPLRHAPALSQRARGLEKKERQPFAPPEDWYEPSESAHASYRIVVQPPGDGFRHVVTPAEIRQRLSAFPEAVLEPLEVIQLSRMTRKKQSFPCYGMQWGATLYLYPIEDSLVEIYCRPPVPAQLNETRMYGGKWLQDGPDDWRLVWSEEAVKDFYLNNILIHELGHLLDDRNSSYSDRERFAEWFAIEHGYKRSPRKLCKSRPRRDQITRRHHAV